MCISVAIYTCMYVCIYPLARDSREIGTYDISINKLIKAASD